MNENYNYVSMAYRTRQLKKELAEYGCIGMEPIRFNSIKRKFSIKKLNKNNIFKNCVKINQNFSENMITALGSSNTQCIYDVDDSFYENLFAGLVEYEALCQLHDKSKSTLGCLLLSYDFACYNLMPDRLIWTFDRKIIHTSLIEFIQNALNINWLDALATLAGILGMDYENIFYFSTEGSVPEAGTVSSRIPDSISLPCQNSRAICTELTQVMSPSGKVIGGFIQYRIKEHTLCLPATTIDGVLSIGKCKPPAFFLNQDEIDRNRSATVIFCADIRTAIALNNALKECRRDTGDFVVTGHLGLDLSILPWNYLHGHPVVFVPAPSAVSLASVKAYREYILGASVGRFSVASNLLLHAAPPCDLQSMADELDNVAEAELLRTAVHIDSIERPSAFLRNLVNNARGYEEFIQWGKNVGIFAVPKQELSLPPKPTAAITFFDPDTVNENSQPTKLADVTAEHIFSGITMLHGPKNVGKSHVVLSAANSLITHNPLWGNFLVNGNTTKALLIDSETTPDNFKNRLNKYELHTLNCNFFSICKLASEQDVNLLDEGFQDNLLEKAKEEGIQTIFFDNLISLVPDGRVYNASSVNGIFRYLEEMQKCNIVPVVVHHSRSYPDNNPDKATMRGTSEFSIRAHTEIVITSPEKGTESSLPCQVLDAMNRGDFTVGIHFKVCKAAHILEGKTFWLHMPSGTTGFKPLTIIDREGKELPLRYPVADNSGERLEGRVVPSMETPDELSDEEKRVLQEAGRRGELRNADVQKLLECSDSKAGKILAGLVDKGLLKKQGEGRGCHYVVKA